MDSQPTLRQLQSEVEAVEALQNEADDQASYAFMSGLIRALNWAAGTGMAPSEFIKASDRVNRCH